MKLLKEIIQNNEGTISDILEELKTNEKYIPENELIINKSLFKGSGGFSKVYAGTKKNAEESLAIKIYNEISTETLLSDDMCQRITVELDTLHRIQLINSQYVVKYYGFSFTVFHDQFVQFMVVLELC